MDNRKRAILTGMALGDGCLSHQKSGLKYHSSLIIKHSSKQLELITHKRDLIHSIIGGKKPNIRHINNNGYPGVIFSKGDRYFRVLRKLLYKNGKKKITRRILDRLNPEAIAIWYMDDGGLSAKKRKGIVHAYELFLNTHETKEDNQIIIDYFKEVHGITFKSVKNKGSYRLRMGTREIRKFIPIIKSFIIPSMLYKIDMSVKPVFNKECIFTSAPAP